MVKNLAGALNMLKGKFSGNTKDMVTQAVGMMAPLMDQFYGDYDKPVEEGGLLEEGDYGCCFSVVKAKVVRPDGSEYFTSQPYIFVLAYNEQTHQMYIRKRIPFLEMIAKAQVGKEQQAAEVAEAATEPEEQAEAAPQAEAEKPSKPDTDEHSSSK